MDILRDPVWQFVGVLVTLLAVLVPLIYHRFSAKRSRPQRTYDIYLSYPVVDRKDVQALAQALEAMGLEVFMDTKLASGDDWQAGLDAALRASRAVGFCITPNSRSASGQQQEIGKATGIEPERIRIIPILFPGADFSDLPNGLQRFMVVDLRSGITAAALTSILSAVSK